MTKAQILEAELQAAWNRKLYQWWSYYNEEYLDGALRCPLITLGHSHAVLGRWYAVPRRIEMALEHINTGAWLDVMETLRHEMAHQYVDEVLKPTEEKPHGPAFRYACKRLRCTPQSRGVAAGNQPETEAEALLRRLRKVLSLASSPNEHEAQAAVKKARQLLLEYNIDLVELDQERAFTTKVLGAVKGRRASYELWLAQILHAFFFVEVLWVPSYRAEADKDGSVLQVYGTLTNLAMAAYVYDYLTLLLERLWKSYKDKQAVSGNRHRQIYFAGVLEGFYGKLQAQTGQMANSTALVWKGDSRLQEYYRYMNPHIRTRRGRGVRVNDAYHHGLEEGQRVNIHRPLQAQAEGFGGYLSE
jgi:hypothetical protein